MNRSRIAGVVGVLAAIGAVVVIGAPAVDAVAPAATGLGTYYAQGILGGVFTGFLAGTLLVVAVALIGIRRGQADPAVASGTSVGLGVVATLLTLEWALAVDSELVAQLGRTAWLAWHRWAVLVLVAVVPVSAFAQRRFRDS
jgi:hypothetical protein